MKAKRDKAKDAAETKKEKKTKSQDKNAIIKAKDAVIKDLDQNGNGTVDIEDIIVLAIKTPGVHITRANFLKKSSLKTILKKLSIKLSQPRPHKMKIETVSIVAQNVEKIEALFPNCVTEPLR